MIFSILLSSSFNKTHTFLNSEGFVNEYKVDIFVAIL